MDLSSFKFFRKGSANAIYRYGGSDLELVGKVLRLRLAGQLFCSAEIHSYMRKFRILSQWIVPNELVEIDRTKLPILETSEIRLLDDDYGILMENILKGTEYETVVLNKHIIIHLGQQPLLELKPKWLYKRTTAVCRNCALAKSRGESFLNCPLRLLTANGIDLWSSMVEQELLLKHDKQVNGLREAMAANLSLFSTLQELQNLHYDVHEKLMSLTGEDDVDVQLCDAMTLRDVTVFIDLSTQRASICDMDRKNTAKWSKWKNQEEKLHTLMQ
ncbi:hypothetical protein OGAPHI_005905 [Ogataea philodendri]|uniref:Inositol-pentakisphosphate 2-kinase n=1 Tax=Ogataea philodendri TaxID=1378263 RepID=A0A9P8NY60_9ASCO|nr:uncharacterized protein OGAPHI_005905 [Ogataea philodendri]KAH3661727.1 hypothetical protein OGAPHI_005905 [Ogataea philodendri]